MTNKIITPAALNVQIYAATVNCDRLPIAPIPKYGGGFDRRDGQKTDVCHYLYIQKYENTILAFYLGSSGTQVHVRHALPRFSKAPTLTFFDMSGQQLGTLTTPEAKLNFDGVRIYESGFTLYDQTGPIEGCWNLGFPSPQKE